MAYTYYIDLEGNFPERFSKSVRREVRKAEDTGLHIEKLNDVATHHKLLTQVFDRQDQDTPVEENFFTSMLGLTERKNVAACGLHEMSLKIS